MPLGDAFISVNGVEYAVPIALRDGSTGDGPGGTEHMVNAARARGVPMTELKNQNVFKTT